MPVIVGTRIEARCASITGMIRHYAEPEGRVIFDHRHNADERASAVTHPTGIIYYASAVRCARGVGAHISTVAMLGGTR
jgi:hypothetical protein